MAVRSATTALEALVTAYSMTFDADKAVRAFSRDFPPLAAKLRRALGLDEVPGAPAGYFQANLSDGSTGFFQRRADDCEQAAIATVVGLPMHRVPDLELHVNLFSSNDYEATLAAANATMCAWLAEHHITVRHHPTPPLTGKWIAVTGDLSGFNSHCLVMNGRDVLFDPASLAPGLPGLLGSDWREDFNVAMTIE